MLKEKVKTILNENKKVVKVIRNYSICAIICFGIGVLCGDNQDEVKVANDKVDQLTLQLDDKIEETASLNKELRQTNVKVKELQTKVDEAKPWFDLKEEERKAEEQKLAEEKAKKEEEERIAKEQADAEAKAQKEAEEQAKKEAEAHKYETGLTWEQIARDGMVGTLGQFEGKIIQVMSGSGYTQYRVAIGGSYDNIMLVEVDDSIKSETLLEDDYVYFKGMSMGTTSYTTIMGAEMTIPAFVVDEITR